MYVEQHQERTEATAPPIPPLKPFLERPARHSTPSTFPLKTINQNPASVRLLKRQAARALPPDPLYTPLVLQLPISKVLGNLHGLI